MNLSLSAVVLATLPSAMFALLVAVLLRQRSIVASLFVFVCGGLANFILSMLMTRVFAGWIDIEPAVEGQATLAGAALDALFAAALPEEASRLLVLIAACGCLRRFRRPADVVAFGALVGFGFALVENLFYGLTSSGAFDSLMRLIPTLSHGFDGLIMAAFLARAASIARRRWLYVGLALLVPVLLHFLFDFGQFSVDALGPRIDNVDSDADATPATLVLLGTALILLLSPIIVWLIEALAAVLIVRRIRRDLRISSVTQQPIVSVQA